MKKIISLSLICFLICLTGIFSSVLIASADAPNLILNPGFEDGENNWVDWTADGTVSSVEKNLGNNAVRINKNTAKIAQKNISVSAATDYTFSFYAKITAVSSSHIINDCLGTWKIFKAGTTTQLASGSIFVNDQSKGWFLVTTSFNTGTNTAVDVVLNPYCYSADIVFYDDLVFRLKNTGPGLFVEQQSGTVSDSEFKISGRTYSDAVVTIGVNGVPVMVNSSDIFSKNVNLKPGANIITIYAQSAAAGNTYYYAAPVTLNVNYNTDNLSFLSEKSIPNFSFENDRENFSSSRWIEMSKGTFSIDATDAFSGAKSLKGVAYLDGANWLYNSVYGCFPVEPNTDYVLKWKTKYTTSAEGGNGNVKIFPGRFTGTEGNVLYGAQVLLKTNAPGVWADNPAYSFNSGSHSYATLFITVQKGTFNLDDFILEAKVKPVVSMNQVKDSWIEPGSYTVTGNTSAKSSVSLTINGGTPMVADTSYGSNSFAVPVTLGEGKNTVSVTATNDYSQSSDPVTFDLYGYGDHIVLENYEFQDKNGAPLQAVSENGSAYCQLNITNITAESKKFFIALAVFDGEFLKHIDVSEPEILSTKSESIKVGVEQIQAGDNVKVFIWNEKYQAYHSPPLTFN
ncbi:MAG: hypothetical protein BGN88_12590 [Clostridiales bacterium 43-6]|nr:MAG: hypothetical protein BGN88_12590 [Clostridiales bacterium 43-6]